MKTKILLGVLCFAVLCGCSKSTKPEFLYLNASQLKPLGIEMNEKGVFYKNENPNFKQDHQKYACLAFACSDKNYLSSTVFDVTDTLKTSSGVDSFLVVKEFTKNDFYPLLIGDTKGHQSMDNENVGVDVKLLPVAICMSETNLPNRKDTVIAWFKPTEALRKALPTDINMEDYLRTR